MSVVCEPLAEMHDDRRLRSRPGQHRPPVIVISGGTNAISIARSLGRRGVAVYALNEPDAHICRSRYARRLEAAGASADSWATWLTGPASDELRGSVLLAASDAGIQLIAQHRGVLEEKFLLDLSNTTAQLTMLDKLGTYRAAVKSGVPTPKFWLAETIDDLAALRDELVYPLLVKPRLSHYFEERFGRKFLIAQSWDELQAAFAQVNVARIDVMLVERIPGPDSQLCSYYTYLDEEGNALFDFTKRILRRWPVGMGGACYHVTDEVPGVRELGLRLFRQVGLRGLANVEFKLDPRDGVLKLIECNARFTAANGLLADCGFDLAAFVYDRLTGNPPTPLVHFRSGVRLWYPLEDFRSFRELHRQGELSFFAWLRSICRPQTFPYFRLSDPLPTLIAEARRLKRSLARLCRLRRDSA